MGTAGGPTVVGCITRRLQHDPCATWARVKRRNFARWRPIERRTCPCARLALGDNRTCVGMTAAVTRSSGVLPRDGQFATDRLLADLKDRIEDGGHLLSLDGHHDTDN